MDTQFKSIRRPVLTGSLVALVMLSAITPSFARGLFQEYARSGAQTCGGYPRGDFAENHPRRAEVLHRDHALNREVQADKGDLSGHYGQLRREDRAIRHQEQSDARANGGYITAREQAQLNREENHVQRQINRDVQ